MSTVTTFEVTGMTCSHCAGAVSAELRALPGVTGVDVDLSPGDVSVVTVTSDGEIDRSAGAAAITEAGYALAGS